MPEEPLKYTHVAPGEDEFSLDRYVIFEQADFVEKIRLGDSVLALNHYYLVLSRRVKIDAPEGYLCDADGSRWGEELVAYACDESGVVDDWRQRAVMTGPIYGNARSKLIYALENGCARWENCPQLDD